MKTKYVRLNIDLSDQMLLMIDEIGERTGAKTKKEIVNMALRFYKEKLQRTASNNGGKV